MYQCKTHKALTETESDRYQSTSQKEKPSIGHARRQSTRAEYKKKKKTHTKSKHPIQTTKPTPELNLPIQFHKRGRKSKMQETKDSQIMETLRKQTTKQNPK